LKNTNKIPLSKYKTCKRYRLLLIFTFLLPLFVLSCKSTKDSVGEQPVKPNNDQHFKHYFHEAILQKMIGQYDRSIELFEKCLTFDQNSSACYFALSDLYERTGQSQKALEYANKAFQLDKTNKWFALRLADLYHQSGNYHQSANYYALGIGDEEENLELKFKYAEALIFSNQYAKAIKVMDEIEIETGKIPELSLTKHDMYLALGDKVNAEAELNSLITSNPGNLEYRLIVAEYFLNTNQTEKAKKIANETLVAFPENGASYVILADVELRSGSLTTAFDYLKKAFAKEDVTIDRKLELIWNLAPYAFDGGANPDAKKIETGLEELFAIIYDPQLKNAQLHYYYGTFLQKQGEKDLALAQFKMVCLLSANDFNAWDQLLNIEYELRAYNDMFEDGKKAVELFPIQPMFYLLTGIGAYESGNYDAAEEYLFLGKDVVVQNNELLAEFYYHLGKVSCLQKQYKEGYRYFEQAKTTYPKLAKAYGSKARFLFLQGDIDEAEKEIKAGLLIDPNNPILLHVQGLLLIKKKNYSEAVKVLEKAAVRDYSNGLILESYGDALYLNGDKEKAISLWIEAEKNGNNSDLLKRKIADKTYYEN